MSEALTAPAERASLADWVAVCAGILGALMALIDVSIVNASLPTIQGSIGATPGEGTWVGTAYLVAEIIAIPLTAWLERMLGMRRLLVGSALMFTLFSIVCGFSANIETMIIGRIGQGLAGGVMIPTGLTIIARRLPPSQQPIGLALTGTTALLGPALGPLLGGWLTENFTWSLIFFINIPVCIAQISLLYFGIPRESGNLKELRNADWFGIAGTFLGLGAATTLLEEGHREQWFDSTFIWQLACISVLGFILVTIGQFRTGRPVIRLSLLRDPGLAAATLLLAVVGMILFSSLYIIPQFLAAIANYNAQQAGQVAVIAGGIAIPVAFTFPLLVKLLPPKAITGLGVACLSVSSLIAGHLTVFSTGSAFTFPQLLFGIGTTLSVLPIQTVVIAGVADDDAAEVNAMTAIARNLGGSIGLAAIASFQEQRFELHRWQLHSAMSANDPSLVEQIGNAASSLGGGQGGLDAAHTMLDGQISQQALVMAFNDMFLVLGTIGLCFVPLALLLKSVKRGAGFSFGH